MADPYDALNKNWEKRVKDLEKKYNSDLKKIQDLYNKRLVELEKELKKNQAAMKNAEREFKEKIQSMKNDFINEFDKINLEHESNFNELRNKIRIKEDELNKIIDESNKILADQEEIKNNLEKKIKKIEEDNLNREKVLREDLLEKKEFMINRISKAEEIDKNLIAHSDGRIIDVQNNIDNIEILATTDKYYDVYTELLVYRVRLSDLDRVLDSILDMAEINMKKDQSLDAIESTVNKFILESNGEYELIERCKVLSWDERRIIVTTINGDCLELNMTDKGIKVILYMRDCYDEDIRLEVQNEHQCIFDELYTENSLSHTIKKIMKNTPFKEIRNQNPVSNYSEKTKKKIIV